LEALLHTKDGVDRRDVTNRTLLIKPVAMRIFLSPPTEHSSSL